MKYIIPIIVVCVIVLYFFIPAKNDKDAPLEIETVFNNLVKSGQRKDINVVMEYFSLDYQDSSGRNYSSIRTIIQNAFDRFDTIEGSYSDLVVSTIEDKNGDTRTIAELELWISGTRNEVVYKLLGTRDNPEKVNITFESLMLGGWKILSVEEAG